MRKDGVCSEVGVKTLLLPGVLAMIIKGRESEATDESCFKAGWEMEKMIGRVLMDAISPKLQELSFKDDIVLTLIARREESK